MNFAPFNQHQLDSDLMPIPDTLLYNSTDTLYGNPIDGFILLGEKVDLTESQIEEFDKDYCLPVIKESMGIFKKKIKELNFKKINISLKLREAKREHKLFCKVVSNTTNILDKDDPLIDLLNTRMAENKKKLDIVSLEEQNTSILCEEGYIKKTLNDFTGLINPSVCNICYENQVTHFINPCGHTICGDCKDKMPFGNDNCHICREKIKKYFKLFL